MAKKNRKCATCGATYSYCPTCVTADKYAPSWKSEFCSEDCKDIYETATKFNLNIISKEEAKSNLEIIGIMPIENYVPMIQNDIKNITSKNDVKETVTTHEVVNKIEK